MQINPKQSLLFIILVNVITLKKFKNGENEIWHLDLSP